MAISFFVFLCHISKVPFDLLISSLVICMQRKLMYTSTDYICRRWKRWRIKVAENGFQLVLNQNSINRKLQKLQQSNKDDDDDDTDADGDLNGLNSNNYWAAGKIITAVYYRKYLQHQPNMTRRGKTEIENANIL